MGQNPTSGLLSIQRRKEIYAVCQTYDIIIVEDDPYWYLQYPSANPLSIKSRGHPVSENYPTEESYNYNTAPGGKSGGFPFLDSLVPSSLSIDVDGRVIRLDTFSKTVAPGCRLGWITAQPAVIERMERITETSTQQPSGFVQSLIAELLVGPSGENGDPGKGGSKDGSGWKVDGWVRWLEGLRGNYERRMQLMCQILEDGKYLVNDNDQRTSVDGYEVVSKTKLYDFDYPMAGMFLWLHAYFETHPVFGKIDNQKLAQALWLFMTRDKYKVLLAPGAMFSPSPQILAEKGWQYFRLCFAAIDDDLVKLHSQHVVDAFVDFWAIDDVKEIEDILKDLEGNEAPASVAEAAKINQVSYR